jgi:hypothetical protein
MGFDVADSLSRCGEALDPTERLLEEDRRLGRLDEREDPRCVLVVVLLLVADLATRCWSDMAGADATDLVPCVRIGALEFKFPN